MERHDEAAEKTTLAAAMMFPRIIEDLPLMPEDFNDYRYESLFRLIRDLARAGQPVDPVNLASRIGDINGLTATDLHAIYEMAPSWQGQAPAYARTVAGLSRGRAVRSLTARLDQAVESKLWDEIDPVLDGVRAELDGIVARTSGVQVRTLMDVFHDAVQDWESPEDRKVWPTGWAELDELLNGGWKPGQVTVLGARPAVGKSAVAACATVAAHRYGVGFFSLEMSERELAGRMLAIQQGVDLGNIERAQFTDEDWARIHSMKQELQSWRVYLEALPRRSMAQIRATVRTWSREGHVPLVIIDYLQLMTPADPRENRERQVSRLAEDCKALAKEFDCHVLVLAQVNRGSTQREDKRPTMSDLRESGGIEANADNIILLHREENPGDYEQASSIEFNLAKNRHGRIGRINLIWRPDYSSANSGRGGPRSYAFGQAPRSVNAQAV